MELGALSAVAVFVLAACLATVLDMLATRKLKDYGSSLSSERAAKREPRFLRSRTVGFPLLEAMFGAATVVSVARHGPGRELARDLLYLSVALLLAAISWHDPERSRAPRGLTHAGVVMGIAASSLLGVDSLVSSLGGAAASLAFFFGLHFLLPRSIGFGSVRTAVVVGAFVGLGWPLLLAHALAFVLCIAAVSLIALVQKRSLLHVPTPFVPWQVLGGAIGLLLG